MNCFAQKVFFAVFALIFLVFPMQAQVDETGRWIYRDGEPAYLNATESPTEKAEIMSRWQKIGDELKTNTSTNEIWGQYWVGDLHIALLRVSEKNGYVILRVNTCAMDIYSVSYGDVYYSADKLMMYPLEQFSSRNSHGGKMAEKMPQEWILAKWKDTNYVIREDEIELFTDLLSGLTNRISNYHAFYFQELPFFSKSSNVVTNVDVPILPLPYRHLIKKPIGGKIIFVDKRQVKEKIRDGEAEKDYYGKPDYESVTEVKINVGKIHGVEKDMVFYLVSGDSEIIEIQTVNEKTSGGIIRRNLEDEPQNPIFKRKDWEIYETLKAGIPVTTSYFVALDLISEKNKAEEKIKEDTFDK